MRQSTGGIWHWNFAQHDAQMAGVCCTGPFFGLGAENRRRDRALRDSRLALPQDELDNLGDDDPDFRYTL